MRERVRGWDRRLWMFLSSMLALCLPHASGDMAPTLDTEPSHISGWRRVVSGGFGDAAVNPFNPLAEFQGQLYAGAFEKTKGCQLLRSADGVTWERVVGPQAATPSGFGNPHNQSINTLTVLGERLYAGTWNEIEGAELWRSADGATWESLVGPNAPKPSGFGKLENSGITALGAFRGRLFAGTGSLYCKDGVELWSLQPGENVWDPIAGERFALQTALARESKYLLAMAAFRDALYVATGDQRTGGSEIWRSGDGRFWEAVVGAPSPYRAGMGHPSHDMIFELAVFTDHLYAAVQDRAGQGGALWRSRDGTTWEMIVGDEGGRYPSGFGQPNIGLVSLAVGGGTLFLGTTNMAEGGQLWVSEDGVHWRCVVGQGARVPGGFGRPSNRSLFSLLAFKGHLYASVDNDTEGGAIWRLALRE